MILRKRKYGSPDGSISLVILLSIIILFVALALESVVSRQREEVKSLTIQMERLELQDEIESSMNIQPICTCQLGDKEIETTAFGIADIQLTELRAGCDTTRADNLIVSTVAGDSKKVAKIAVRNLSRIDGSNLLNGSLEITLPAASGEAVHRPLALKIRVATEPKPATQGKEIVSWCAVGDSRGFLDSCPKGFVLVGTPGLYNSYCIESALHPAANFPNYKMGCAGVHEPGFTSATICRVSSIYSACNSGLINPSASSEWIGDLTLSSKLGTSSSPFLVPGTGSFMIPGLSGPSKPLNVATHSTGLVFGPGTCETMSSDISSNLHPFRCCIYP